LGEIHYLPASHYLRAFTAHADDRVRGVSIIALGELGDAAEFPVLLTLLSDEDDDIARKARIALGYLPLTPVQQKLVDALWEARSYDDAPVSPPAPIISTSPP
jgi:HEAT repeat protein